MVTWDPVHATWSPYGNFVRQYGQLPPDTFAHLEYLNMRKSSSPAKDIFATSSYPRPHPRECGDVADFWC